MSAQSVMTSHTTRRPIPQVYEQRSVTNGSCKLTLNKD